MRCRGMGGVLMPKVGSKPVFMKRAALVRWSSAKHGGYCFLHYGDTLHVVISFNRLVISLSSCPISASITSSLRGGW